MKFYLDVTIAVVLAVILVLGIWKAVDFGLYVSQHLRIEWTP